MDRVSIEETEEQIRIEKRTAEYERVRASVESEFCLGLLDGEFETWLYCSNLGDAATILRVIYSSSTQAELYKNLQISALCAIADNDANVRAFLEDVTERRMS